MSSSRGFPGEGFLFYRVAVLAVHKKTLPQAEISKKAKDCLDK